MRKADLAESSPVAGCIPSSPTVRSGRAWSASWTTFRSRGHQNLYFPRVPELPPARGGHVEGSLPSAPTSPWRRQGLEGSYSAPPQRPSVADLRSVDRIYRDLPLLYNQWANVMRWECAQGSFCAQEVPVAGGTHCPCNSGGPDRETLQMVGIYRTRWSWRCRCMGEKSATRAVRGRREHLHRGDEGSEGDQAAPVTSWARTSPKPSM